MPSLVPTLAALAACGVLVAAESPKPVIATGHGLTVHADDTGTPTHPSLDEVQADLDRVPGGTTLIRAETLRERRTATLRDALQTAPGVYVQPRFGTEESRLSIRGSGVSRTFHLRGIALLQDGQPISAADGSADFQAFDANLVEGITIHRGANALQDGAATLGGSVAFTSPTGRSADRIRLRGEAGSFGYIKASADGGFVHDRLDGWVGVSGYVSDGFREHSAQENLRTFGNLGWTLTDIAENRLFLSYTDSDSELPGSLTKTEMEADPTQSGAGAVNRDTKRDYPLLRVADRLGFAWDGGDAQVGLGFMDKDLFHPLSFGLIDQQSQDLSFDARGRDHRATVFGMPAVITLGGTYLVGETDAAIWNYSGGTGHVPNVKTSDALNTANSASAYAEIEQTVRDDLAVIVGMQYARHRLKSEDRLLDNGDQSGSRTWAGLNPKFGLRWDTSETITCFGNVSRSFEPPTFSEYVQTGPGFLTAPTDIDAQTAWTIEVGSRGASGDWTWDTVLYHALIEGEYLSYVISPGLSNYVNADDTTHTGLELGLGWRLAEGLASDDDSLTLDQVLNWGRFVFVDDATYGSSQLPGLPELSWRGELRYAMTRWYAAIHAEWQDEWYVDYGNTFSTDASIIFGARVGYRDPRGIDVFVEGRNLADEVYAATTGIANPASATPVANQQLFNPGDGRAIYAGLEWRH